MEVLEIELHGEESLHTGPALDICSCQALVVKNPPANAGDVGLVSGSGRFPWRRAWQPTPVFLPGESHGQGRLAGYSPWGCTESDMTEATQHARASAQMHSCPQACSQEGASRVEAHVCLDTSLATTQRIPGCQEPRVCTAVDGSPWPH